MAKKAQELNVFYSLFSIPNEDPFQEDRARPMRQNRLFSRPYICFFA